MQPLPELDLADFCRAARWISFFQVARYGVPETLDDALPHSVRRFVMLPQPEKDVVAPLFLPHFRGYNRMGLEHARGA